MQDTDRAGPSPRGLGTSRLRQLILLAALASLAAPAFADELLDRLLRNAEATEHVFETSLKSRSYIFSMDFTLLDSAGRPDEQRIETYRLEPAADGQMRSTLLSATHDGKDVSDEVRRRNARQQERGRKRRAEGKTEPGGHFADLTPFSAAGRAKHRFAVEGDDGASYRVAIRPRDVLTDDPKDIRVQGYALFDRATEQLTSMTVSPAVLPRRFRELRVAREFDPATTLPRALTVDGEATFLLIFHKRFHVTTRWSGWQ